MKILVTGGAGFIGSHLTEVLVSAGHRVTVLDDLSTGSIDNVSHLERHPGFRFVCGSVGDEHVTGRLIAESDAVVHLAAAVGVKLIMASPVRTMETNGGGTAVVLRHAAAHGTRVIVASTSEVYGKSAALPFREDGDMVFGAPSKTRWGYAVSKLFDEFLALGYWQEQRLPVTVVRFFNTVGPRQSSRYGMVLPTFVRQALEGEPLVVHGTGRQTRSFTWVGDVVHALMALITAADTAGEVFNIGNDEEVEILDLARRVCRTLASDSEIAIKPYSGVFGSNFEDMMRRVPDISKIRQAIGFSPTVQLDEIIEHTANYWKVRRPAPASTPLAAVSTPVASGAPA